MRDLLLCVRSFKKIELFLILAQSTHIMWITFFFIRYKHLALIKWKRKKKQLKLSLKAAKKNSIFIFNSINQTAEKMNLYVCVCVPKFAKCLQVKIFQKNGHLCRKILSAVDVWWKMQMSGEKRKFCPWGSWIFKEISYKFEKFHFRII